MTDLRPVPPGRPDVALIGSLEGTFGSACTDVVVVRWYVGWWIEGRLRPRWECLGRHGGGVVHEGNATWTFAEAERQARRHLCEVHQDGG